jgi:hypothetical protein
MLNLDPDAPYKLCFAGDLKLASTTAFLPPRRFIYLFLLAEYSSTVVELVVDISSDLSSAQLVIGLKDKNLTVLVLLGVVSSTCCPRVLLKHCSVFFL